VPTNAFFTSLWAILEPIGDLIEQKEAYVSEINVSVIKTYENTYNHSVLCVTSSELHSAEDVDRCRPAETHPVRISTWSRVDECCWPNDACHANNARHHQAVATAAAAYTHVALQTRSRWRRCCWSADTAAMGCCCMRQQYHGTADSAVLRLQWINDEALCHVARWWPQLLVPHAAEVDDRWKLHVMDGLQSNES